MHSTHCPEHLHRASPPPRSHSAVPELATWDLSYTANKVVGFLGGVV